MVEVVEIGNINLGVLCSQERKHHKRDGSQDHGDDKLIFGDSA